MLSVLQAVACHFIGDFAFQSDWMAKNKGSNWEVMNYHCLVYIAPFILFGATLPQLYILWATHLVIDVIKARFNWIKSIWADQLLHLGVILALFGGLL